MVFLFCMRGLLCEVLLELCELCTQLSGYMIAELCVELVDALSLFLPQILVNAEQAAQGLDVEVQTLEVAASHPWLGP